MDPTLKQRLVGTAVLVALAVIFVPMLLDGPVESVPERRVTGVPLALPEPLPAPETAQPSSDSAAPPASSEAEASAPLTTPPAATPASGGFAVQLGAFREAAAAEALAARLRDAGFDGFVLAGGGWHRVRVGPLPDRPTAEALAVRIHRAIDEPTQVVTHP